MSRFTLPRDIYYGANALENLKNLKGKKAVLVLGGGSMKRFGFVDKALAYLKEAGIETKLIENVEPDPSVETVMNGAAVMREFEPDWIISMGGGSPIDAAKAMWAFYEYPETTFEDLITPFNFPELRQKAKFCAIPSTSGTATEVTAFSVITDYHKGHQVPVGRLQHHPGRGHHRSGPGRDHASQAGGSHRYGRTDPRDRGLCVHLAHRVHRSAGAEGDRYCEQRPH